MRVLITLSSGRRGGAERVAALLATGLARLGDRVAVALREGPVADELEAGGLRVHRLGFGDGLDPFTPLALAYLARDYDLIHAHMNRAALMSRLAAWGAGRPWVATAHGMTRGVYYRGADRVLAVSEAVAGHLRAQGVGRVVAVPNALPAPDPVDPGRVARLRERAGAGPGRVLAVVLANFHPNKGQTLALEALARCRGPLRLLLVGAGVDGPELAAVAARLGVGTRATRLGSVDDPGAVLEAADLVLVPSEREAFSLVALEARMRGRPVLAADADGLREVVPDGRAGCLRVAGRDPGRWAAALDHAAAGIEALGMRARAAAGAVVAEFAPGPWLERHRGLYEAVVRDRRA